VPFCWPGWESASQTPTKCHRGPETFKENSRPEPRAVQLNEHDDSFEGAAVEVELIIAAFSM